MAVPPPLRDPDENTARGLQRVSAGVQQGRRAGLATVRGLTTRGTQSSGEAWVVVEAEADIVPKSHPYVSFDPDGTY